MATLTIYILNTPAAAPNWFGSVQIGGGAPPVVSSSFGYQTGKIALTTPYYRGRLGATGATNVAQAASWNASTSGPTKGTGNASTTAGDSFVAGPFTGTFAATAWTFNWLMTVNPSAAAGSGHVNMRVWKSANADGSSPTQLLANTAGATGNAGVGDFNSSISWSPGTLTLNNEYLFFQVEWQATATGGLSSSGTVFGLGSARSAVVTPDFVGTYGVPLAPAAGFNMPMMGL